MLPRFTYFSILKKNVYSCRRRFWECKQARDCHPESCLRSLRPDEFALLVVREGLARVQLLIHEVSIQRPVKLVGSRLVVKLNRPPATCPSPAAKLLVCTDIS